MDRQKTKRIADAVIVALATVAAEFECEVDYKGGKYSDNAATLKIEFAERAADGTVMTQMATDFQNYALSVGLKPDDLGASFERNGTSYKIVGFKPRATKMPVICETPEGKRYKLREADVVRGLGREAVG
jgi:hypothetical protein